MKANSEMQSAARCNWSHLLGRWSRSRWAFSLMVALPARTLNTTKGSAPNKKEARAIRAVRGVRHCQNSCQHIDTVATARPVNAQTKRALFHSASPKHTKPNTRCQIRELSFA